MLRSLRERLAESRQAFAAVFTNPGLRRLELSWTGTVCAYWIFIVTLSLFAYEHGGAGAVGLVGLLRVLPSVVASPFGAVLGDRYPRERVMVGINLARSLTIAGAAVAAFAGAPAGIVYALGSLMGLLQSTFRPTQAALLPQLARSPEELTAANLVLTTIEGMGIFLGPRSGDCSWQPPVQTSSSQRPPASFSCRRSSSSVSAWSAARGRRRACPRDSSARRSPATEPSRTTRACDS